jgi:hypothetical protein
VRQAGRPRGAHDLIIAATARASKRTVVSSNLTAFADLPGVTVRNHGESDVFHLVIDVAAGQPTNDVITERSANSPHDTRRWPWPCPTQNR